VKSINRKVDSNLKNVIRRNKKAIPAWFSIRQAENFFFNNRNKPDYTMDHIIPLNHTKVCGLHCKDNWKAMTREINTKKSNKFYTTAIELSIMKDLYRRGLALKC